MHSGKEIKMKLNKLQKRILICLIILCLVTPLGIFLPMLFNAGQAWGEWSAHTVNDLIGYVPQGLARYSETWKAPVAGYTLNTADRSVIHQSGFYIVSGIAGATLTYIVMLVLSKIMIRNEK